MKDLTVTSPLCEDEYNELLRQAVAVLPWSHNLLLMSYNLSSEHIVFYANEVFRSSYNLGFIDAIEPLQELVTNEIQKSTK